MEVRVERIDLEKDLEAICAIHENVFGRKSFEVWHRRLRWQFFDNPAARVAAPRMYAGRNAGGEIIGYLGSFPARLKIGDREVITYEGADLSVLKAARGLGLGSKLVAAYLENEEVITIAHGTGVATARIFEKMGLALIRCDPNMMRITNCRPIVDHLAQAGKLPLAARGFPSQAVFSGAAGTINAWMTIRNNVMRPRPSGAISVRAERSIGGEFDEFWQRTAPHFPIAFVHDAEFLRWRCLMDPGYTHRLISARGAGGELLGWIDTVATTVWGASACVIMDLFCDPERADVVDTLIHAVLTGPEGQAVDLLSCRGLMPALRDRVARYLPVRLRRHDFPSYVKWKGEPEIATFVATAANWHITHADGDVGFFMG